MSEEVKYFSKEELSEHSSRESLWVLIDKSIYDLTEFMDEHPGGEEILLEQAGTDATENFEDVGHSTDARELMKDYKIGELRKEDQASAPKSEPSVHDLQPQENESFLKSWLIPIAIAVTCTLIYRYYIHSSLGS